MIHRLLFSAKNIVAKSSIALLLAILTASIFAVPAFATSGGGVLYTSGYADGGYYYECTYTPIYDDHHGHGGYDYDNDGYHVACVYSDIDDDGYGHDDDDGNVHGYGHGNSHKNGHGYGHGNNHKKGHGHDHDRRHCKYTVQLGDNLSTIAAQYGVSFTKLAHKNGLEYPYYLYVGNVLRVPCHY